MKVLQISRKVWLRGQDAWEHSLADDEPVNESTLRREHDGKMCCLGIYLHACGVPEDDLEGLHDPSEVHYILPEEARWLVRLDGAPPMSSDVADEMMLVNDAPAMDDDAREAGIAAHFLAHGIQVEFVD